MKVRRFVFASLCIGALSAVVACSGSDGSSTDTGSGDGTGDKGKPSGSASGTGSGSDNGATPGTSGTPGNPGGSGTPGATDPGTGGTPGSTDPGTGGMPSGGPGITTITANETWADGKQITGPVVIANGAVVTIAPGAKVTVADGASITVTGTLKAASATKHAKLTGKAWTGLVLWTGGTLDVDGVDIENAATALDARAGNALANYVDGIVTAPTTPFKIAKGGKLTMTRSSVVGAKGMSTVAGTFTASYLDYDANGNEGISAVDASAILTIDDSKFHGATVGVADMIVSNVAASIHVAHTEITKCHCAFHFNGITAFDISFVDIHDDAYGFMLYGSDATAAKRTIASSDFANLQVGIDESGTNGAISVTGCYMAPTTKTPIHLVDQQITVSKVAQKPVAGVGPRSAAAP